MHLRGTYRKTLYRLFTTAAILTALILCVLTGWFLNKQAHLDYSYYLEQSARSQEAASAISASIIVQAIGDCMGSGELSRWADSPSLQEFYFYAIAASKKLKSVSTDMLQVEYEVAATPLNPRVYDGTVTDIVLTPNRSMTAAVYCRSQGISDREYSEIIQYFQNHDQPYFLPVYDPLSGELLSIQYVLKDKSSHHPLLFFFTIPRKSIVSESFADAFFLYNKDGVLAFSNNLQERRQDSLNLYESLMTSGGESSFRHPQLIKKRYLLVTEISPFQWIAVFQYPPLPLHLERLIGFGTAVFAAVSLAIFLAYWISERLYHPVKELIETAAALDSGQEEKSLDEFALIRKNLEKITELGSLLHIAMEENNSLMSIQSCKELLFSQNTDPAYFNQFKDPDADYCVAIGETLCLEDERSFQAIAIQKALAYDTAFRRDNVFYINLDYNRYALILCTSSPEDARSTLNQLLREIEVQESAEDSHHRIVLSSIHQGLSELHICYREALRILDFRYLHAKSRLISYEEISSIDAITYSYPLQVENRLIQCALNGQEEATAIFENMIRENIRDKDLSKETLQNLIYAFIGTLSRIFQELKTTPEEFLGKKVDYKYLYNHWNDSTVFIEIKGILEEIIQAVKQQETRQDKALLEKMLRYIYENYQDDIMLTDLADHLNISPKYCSNLFKQLSDNNFKDFLNLYRIEKSKEILAEDPSVKIVDLSSMVGFNSSNSFIRVFNKYVGISPKAYRDRIQKP